jgi:hypothetical protein
VVALKCEFCGDEEALFEAIFLVNGFYSVRAVGILCVDFYNRVSNPVVLVDRNLGSG